MSTGYRGFQPGGIQTKKEDAVTAGEYNLSRTVLAAPANWSITSLLLEHRNMDFRDKKNWDCNHHSHPSRSGTYGDHISVSPLEVIFHKTFWHSGPPVDEREVLQYTKWLGNANYQSFMRDITAGTDSTGSMNSTNSTDRASSKNQLRKET